jgi:sugar lactone lactonase YvrE
MMWISAIATSLGIVASIGGSARGEEFHYPLKPAVAENGTIYVADRKLPGILMVKDGHLETFFKASKKFGTPLNGIRTLTVDRAGKVLAGDSATREIYRFDAPDKPTPLIQGAQAGIGIPMGIAVDSKGVIYVSDLEANCIWKLPSAGGAPAKFVDIPAPRGIAIDGQDQVWVVSGSSDQLLRISPAAKIAVVVSGRPFQFPNDVVVAPDGTAYVSDGYAKTVWKIGSDGKPQPWVSRGALVNPVGLDWHKGQLLIADPNPKSATGQVYMADEAGKIRPLLSKPQ